MAQAVTQTKKRIGYFDIAKGIALFAVMVGHTSEYGMPWPVVTFCYSFDMPLFFIVSGWFCRPSARLDRGYVKKNAKALLLPYAATCVILLALMTLRGLVMPGHGGGVSELLPRWTIACLYGAGGTWPDIMPAGITGVGAIWYLLALFFAKILLTWANQTRYPAAAIGGLFAFGYLTADKFWLPWSVQAACCAVFWMWLGQKARASKLLEPGSLHHLTWWIMLAAWLYCARVGGNLWMVANVYSDGVVLDTLGGICGALCVLKGCMLLEQHGPRIAEPIRAFGTITLPVFCMHLVEMDAFPWDIVQNLCAGLPVPSWVVIFAGRCVVIAALTGLLYLLPRPISGLFFPSRRPAAQSTSVAKS